MLTCWVQKRDCFWGRALDLEKTHVQTRTKRETSRSHFSAYWRHSKLVQRSQAPETKYTSVSPNRPHECLRIIHIVGKLLSDVTIFSSLKGGMGDVPLRLTGKLSILLYHLFEKEIVTFAHTRRAFSQ